MDINISKSVHKNSYFNEKKDIDNQCKKVYYKNTGNIIGGNSGSSSVCVLPVFGFFARCPFFVVIEQAFGRFSVMQNEVICKCKNVTYNDVEKALHSAKVFSDVEKEFEEVQKITNCSTGCGGCHDKILDAISEIMAG